MAKVTEKTLKARCTELNMGPLKSTTFEIRATRTGKGYIVDLQYRDGTPPQVLLEGGTAEKASATVEGAAFGAAAVKVAGGDKPEFATRETFIRQAGERCPKCSTKDIAAGHLQSVKGDDPAVLLPVSWSSIYRLDDYEAAVAVAVEV